MHATTFAIDSFGCRVNQAEGEALAERLMAAGLCPVPPGGEPDLVVVNTCAVTAEAARQCRQRIRRARRRGARVAVTGCYAHPGAIDDALRAIADLVCIEPDKDRAAERLVEALLGDRAPAGRGGPAAIPSPLTGEGKGEGGPGPLRPGEREDVARSRALLKVQDGCPASCTYCVVRIVRPEPQSLPPEEAVQRARRLVGAGYREIVVCGIHLGLYGADLAPQAGLTALLEELLAVPGLGRVRLSSLEPMEVTPELLALMASEPEGLCPHLHLPLQSGDDAVLGRMNRPYAADAFLEVVRRVRRALDEPALTTDVLVGFPGEDEAAFERTLAVAREARFSRMHVFPFSRRPGTAAAGMDGQVPGDVVRERCGRARALAEELGGAYRARLVGREGRVVVERLVADGAAEGTSERFVRVRIAGPLPEGVRRRDIVPVRLTCAGGDGLEAEALDPRA
jgi:threonylcarbamoyladenosine tRNA methylthiotransferase MtaB